MTQQKDNQQMCGSALSDSKIHFLRGDAWCRAVWLAKNDLSSVLQKKQVFGSVLVVQN